MTTQVMILNRGPELVKIEVQGRGADGKYMAAQEHVIAPRQYVELWVHSTQSLQVLELKAELPKPAVAEEAAA